MNEVQNTACLVCEGRLNCKMGEKPGSKHCKVTKQALLAFKQQALTAGEDPWKHRMRGMRCATCMWFMPKMKKDNTTGKLGRCRRHAPFPYGFPPIFEDDWCGDHRLDENKV